MQVKDQILNALQSSLVPDSQKIKQATTFLTEIRQQQGYCLVLMQIIDSANFQIPIKQAALVQLKNTVKIKWSAKKVELYSVDKQAIKGAIVTAIIRCTKDNSLIKLYREVLTIIVGHDYKTWLPIQQIALKLRSGKDLSSVLHCLLGISGSFEFSIEEEERQHFFNFLKKMLPELRNSLQQNQSPEMIYLCIKFLWKGVHYDVDEGVKALALEWMPLLLMIFGNQNAQFDSNKNLQEFQQKNTPQFFYFHAKKWTTRILLRFVQKHAKIQLPKKSRHNLKFSQEWYNNFGYKFVEILFKQLTISTAPKVRYFQMKCIQSLVSEKPDSIRNFAQKLQYEILLPYLMLKEEDEELANSDPIEFLNRESEPCMNFTNLKRVATDIWVDISEIEHRSEKEGKKYTPGPFFYNNMNYLKNKLETGNQLEKEMAMYLICQLRSVVIKCTQVKDMMPSLISTYVIPQFTNKIMFLRARAVDIFFQYGSFGFPIEVLKKATEGIFICLTQDQHALVRIKAASAFNCILRHKMAKELVRPLLKDILAVYVRLLEQYDLESLVSSLESIIEDFSIEIEPFAAELVKYLLKLFTKLFHKDLAQSSNDDYSGETEMAAAGCLKTVTQIIDAPLSQNVIRALEGDVVQLCYFVFSDTNTDYTEDLLVLLNSYLYKVDKLGPEIWFFYQVIVYNITGIPKEVWAQLESSTMSDQQKGVLKNVKNGGNDQMMQQSMLVLRNYIQKGSSFLLNNPDPFKTNLVQLLFLLVAEVYKKGPGQFTGQVQMTCCTALLVNFIENNSSLPEAVLLHIWQLSKYNIVKLKSKNLKGLNSQLLSMLIYCGGVTFLAVVKNQNMMETLLKELIDHESKLEEDYEFQRMILGLSTLITIPERPQPLMDKFPDIFKLLIKFLKNNIEFRLQDFADKEGGAGVVGSVQSSEEYDEQDPDCIDGILDGPDDDQEFWEELHDQNYESRLCSVDEVKFFEDSIKKIQREQPQFYPNMMQIVSQEELGALGPKIQKAIEVFQKSQTQ